MTIYCDKKKCLYNSDSICVKDFINLNEGKCSDEIEINKEHFSIITIYNLDELAETLESQTVGKPKFFIRVNDSNNIFIVSDYEINEYPLANKIYMKLSLMEKDNERDSKEVEKEF